MLAVGLGSRVTRREWETEPEERLPGDPMRSSGPEGGWRGLWVEWMEEHPLPWPPTTTSPHTLMEGTKASSRTFWKLRSRPQRSVPVHTCSQFLKFTNYGNKSCRGRIRRMKTLDRHKDMKSGS